MENIDENDNDNNNNEKYDDDEEHDESCDFIEKMDQSSSSNQSWTTSEDNSSGNEYSVKTKAEKKVEEMEILQSQKSKKKKQKKKHKKKRKKHKKHHHRSRSRSHSADPQSTAENSKSHKKHKKHKSKSKKCNQESPRSHSSASVNSTSSKKKKKHKKTDESDIETKLNGKEYSPKENHSQKRKSGSRHSSRSRDRSKHRSQSRDRSSSRHRSHRHSKDKSKSRHHSRSRHRSKSRHKSRSRQRSRSRHRSRSRRSRSRSHGRHRSRNRHRSRSRSRSRNSDNHKKSPLRGYQFSSSKSFSTDEVFMKASSMQKKDINIKIDVNKSTSTEKKNKGSSLLGEWEPAPKRNEVVNYTKLCAEISAGSKDPESKDYEVIHPYKVPDKPLPSLPHIPRHLQIPTNPAQAIMAGTMVSLVREPIEKCFPVSSGVDHREHEENKTVDKIPLYEAATESTEKINISGVIARRLGAQQILSSNPNDASAHKVLADCDHKLKIWTAQNKKPGKFTGEIGSRMGKKEIAGDYETWVKKDFFHNLQPVSGGIGMRMMQSMGWRQGQPLGRNNEGFTAPITFDVKVGRGGLYSIDEAPPTQNNRMGLGAKQKSANSYVPNINGKHPVSLLSELAIKNKWGIPEYQCVFEEGRANSKNFLMKVTLQHIDYQPAVASTTKKHAKANAAFTALKLLGFAKD